MSGFRKELHSFKESIENFWLKLHITSSDVIRFIAAFGIGFLTGLFLKRYVKYVIEFALGVILLLAIFQYFKLITIEYAQIKSFLGLSEAATFETVMQVFLTGIRTHAILISCALLGCLLGFKVG